MRVPYDDLLAGLHSAVVHLGLSDEPEADGVSRALRCATLFAETTCDGVYSHGLNRFPRFAATVRNGTVDVEARPSKTGGFGCIERWDGHRGPGNLNAYAAMQRAIHLAAAHGMGAVALGNTNHWMRGGSYGWQAAAQGCIGICWTNTSPNTPAWGSALPAVGNNPMIFAIPCGFRDSAGEQTGNADAPIVLDIAMTQFSYGALAGYTASGLPLPVPGGYDTQGELTQNSAAIELSQRALPIGFWKGYGLSVVTDVAAAMLAAGLTTHQISKDPLHESGLSQFFLAVDPRTFGDSADLAAVANGVLDDLHRVPALDPARPVRYPGEETLRVRAENLRLGVPVEPQVWQEVLAL